MKDNIKDKSDIMKALYNKDKSVIRHTFQDISDIKDNMKDNSDKSDIEVLRLSL